MDIERSQPDPSLIESPASFAAMPLRWRRFAVVTIAVAAILAFVSGIPTDLIPNDYFTRMTPIQGYAYPVWAASALMGGALVASYLAGPGRIGFWRKTGGSGGIGFAYLAVGCPVCNKLVVLALGVSGALTYFAPLQPYLAALSILGLAAMLGWRTRELRRGVCAIDAAPDRFPAPTLKYERVS